MGHGMEDGHVMPMAGVARVEEIATMGGIAHTAVLDMGMIMTRCVLRGPCIQIGRTRILKHGVCPPLRGSHRPSTRIRFGIGRLSTKLR